LRVQFYFKKEPLDGFRWWELALAFLIWNAERFFGLKASGDELTLIFYADWISDEPLDF
jgi:hypothetical protein